jgi:ribosomal protein S25
LSQKQEQRRQPEKTKTAEKRSLGVSAPSLGDVESFVKTQPYVTPSVLGERFGVRLSIAKRLLKTMAERGLLRPASGVTGLKLYMPMGEVKLARKAQVMKQAEAAEVVEAQPQPTKGKKKKSKSK